MTKHDEISATQATNGSEDQGYLGSAKGPSHYNDRTISTKDWASRTFSDIPGQFVEYLISLFPIATWIYRYNLTWLTGDVIAGLTVGAVVVPQGMSYAVLATLGPEFGLYTSFVGVFIYSIGVTQCQLIRDQNTLENPAQ